MIGPDVLVLGEGPAGAAAALRLATKGVQVWLLGTPKRTPAPPGETLPPLAKTELAKLGAERAVEGALPSYGIEAHWGSTAHFRSHVFDAHGNGLHIGHDSFAAGLIAQAVRAGARRLSLVRLETLARSGERWDVGLSGNGVRHELSCRFVIDATGRARTTATLLGIRRRRADALCGVMSICDMNSRQSTLRIESAPYGWWYTSPIPNGQHVVCLMSDADIIRSLSANRAAVWQSLLASTDLGRLVSGSTANIQVLPCESSVLEAPVAKGWVAVGDAASVFDPLSSAGIVKAIHDARVVGDCVAESLAGEHEMLADYGLEVRRGFEHYLAARCSQYRLETRWPDHPFWRRRMH